MNATAPNFQSILDMPVESIERPKPLPVGTYLATVAGAPKFDKNPKTGNDFAEFTFNLVQPLDDVDQSALQEAGGLAGKTVRNAYWLTPDALYRLREFLEHLGIDTKDVKLKEAIAMAPGRQVMVSITHATSKDGTSVYANVNRTAAV